MSHWDWWARAHKLPKRSVARETRAYYHAACEAERRCNRKWRESAATRQLHAFRCETPDLECHVWHVRTAKSARRRANFQASFKPLCGASSLRLCALSMV